MSRTAPAAGRSRAPSGLAVAFLVAAVAISWALVSGSQPVAASDTIAAIRLDAGTTWTETAAGNSAPVVSNPGAQSSTEGDPVSLTIVASDADGDTLTYGASGLPSGLSIDSASGAISGTIGAGASSGSPYSVTATADDGNGGSDSTTFEWTVAAPAPAPPAANSPPVVTNPGAQSSTEGDSVSLTIVASDADGDTLTYGAGGLPGGLSIDAASGEISGAIDSGAASGSPYSVTATADDGNGGSDSATFEWTVVAPASSPPAAGNNPPVVTNPGAQSSTEGDSVSLTIAASDADGDTLTYGAGGLPGGLSIDSASGTIDAGAASGSPYSVTATATADDGNGGSDSATFEWTVAAPAPADDPPTDDPPTDDPPADDPPADDPPADGNSPPVVTNPGAQSSTEGDPVSLTIVASDTDGDALTYGASGLPGGLSIDAASGAISGTIDAGAASGSPYSVTATADDGNGGGDSATFEWTVAASAAPAPALSSATAAPGVFNPVADTYVDESNPTGKYGSRTFLRADGSPVKIAFLRFNVQGVSDFSSAAVMIYMESGSRAGFDVRGVADNTWSASTLTYETAPPVGAVVASSGPVTAGSWVSLDVSSLVGANGLVSFALTTGGVTGIRFASGDGSNPPQLLVPPPAPPPPPLSPSPFVVSRVGDLYQAVSQTTGVTYFGSLKSVVESAVQELGSSGGGAVQFEAGTFDLGSDSFRLRDIHDITFEGQGIDVTVIENSSSAASDSEPFKLSGADRVVIRDLTVRAGGTFRSSSDAIVFDDGNDSLIERVKIDVSRSRGIVFNGKNSGWTADRNVVRDCIIDGVPGDGIELLAASNNLIEGCTITNTGGHGIQINKSSSSGAQPNKKSNDNVLSGNTIDNAGQDGINVNSSDRNQILGNTISNSSAITPNRDGIRIMSSSSVTCDDTLVDSNRAFDSHTEGDEPPFTLETQTYGLSITSALCHRTVATNNNFMNNRLGKVNDRGTDSQIGPIDTEAPFTPSELHTGQVEPFQMALSWDSAGDNVAVVGYTVYRDGDPIAIVEDMYFLDTTLAQQTTYEYTVDAFDAAGNHSGLSAVVTITTPALAATFTVTAEADAYVNADNPNRNYGSSTALRLDGSPDVRSYLRFTVRGISESLEVKRATLRVYTESSSPGHDVRGVVDNTWGEGTITYAIAPAVGGVLGSSGWFDSARGWLEVDVTSFISGNGTFSLALTTDRSTAIRYESREAGRKPELVIETGPPPPPPSTRVLFSDGFESGDLAQWQTTNIGVVTAQDTVNSGSWAARATSVSGEQAYAIAPLSGFSSEVTLTMWFNILSQGENIVYLTRIRDVRNNGSVSIFVTSTGKLAVRNESGVGAGSITSLTSVGPGWHLLELHIVVGGADGSLIEVWLDSAPVTTRDDSLRDTPIGFIEIGDRMGGRIFDVAFDDVQVTAP